MVKKLDFNASITEVKQISPLFSTCKVRVLYTGRNRNMSYISRNAVEKSLPTLINVPIVGEYSEASNDYQGHGGKLDLDSYKYVHTTKPYGVVPESATYSWEEIKGKDGTTREYLTINDCILWTGRYEEAYSIIDKGKGQSMEIEVIEGQWNEEEEVYQIDNFLFSALCILGDDVEPAFEDANITAYSLNDTFKQEFSEMLSALKELNLPNKEGDNDMDLLKKLLVKYSTNMEELTAKGLVFSEISEEELEEKVAGALGVEVKGEEPEAKPEIKPEPAPEIEPEKEPEVEPVKEKEPEVAVPVVEEPEAKPEEKQPEVQVDDEEKKKFEVKIADLEAKLADANEKLKELESLKEFKLNKEKEEHEAKVNKLFSDFQITDEDVKELDIHKFSVEEIEEKCYAIIGKRMASKSFSKQDGKGVYVPIGATPKKESTDKKYGGLLD